MDFIRFLTAPFRRLFHSLRLVSQQVYCGDANECVGLSYKNGNLKQAIPVRVSTWNSCPMPGPMERPKR